MKNLKEIIDADIAALTDEDREWYKGMNELFDRAMEKVSVAPMYPHIIDYPTKEEWDEISLSL